jgi:hypothetical protein
MIMVVDGGVSGLVGARYGQRNPTRDCGRQPMVDRSRYKRLRGCPAFGHRALLGMLKSFGLVQDPVLAIHV